MLGQGVVAVAIAVNYVLDDANLLPNVVFTAAIVSTLLTDVLSGRLAQSVVMQQMERLSARWKRLAQALDLTKS